MRFRHDGPKPRQLESLDDSNVAAVVRVPPEDYNGRARVSTEKQKHQTRHPVQRRRPVSRRGRVRAADSSDVAELSEIAGWWGEARNFATAGKARICIQKVWRGVKSPSSGSHFRVGVP